MIQITSIWITLLTLVGTSSLMARHAMPLNEPSMILNLDHDRRSWSGSYINAYADIRLYDEHISFSELDQLFYKMPSSRFSFSPEIANFGAIKQSIYARLVIETSQEIDTYLDINYNFIETINLRLTHRQETLYSRSGSLVSMDERAIAARSFLFPLKLQPGRNQIDLIIQGQHTVNLPLRLWQQRDFESYREGTDLFIGMAFGAMMMVALYNLVLSINLRDRIFFYYAIFIASHTAHLFFTFGIMQTLGHSLFQIKTFSPLLGSSLIQLSLISSSYFIRSFYQIPKRSGLWLAWISLEVAVVMSLLLALFIAEIAVYTTFGLATIATGLVICTSIHDLYSHQHDYYRKVYAAGWLLYVLGGATALYASFGYLERNWLTIHIHLIVSIGELMLFSLALANKMRQAFDGYEEQQRISTHSYQQLAKVFYPHQIQLIKAGRRVETTMPTFPGKACVICFDVVSSSKIQHEGSKEFFRRVLLRCHQILLEDYDAKTLYARGFRIKEMGDGFLCSVGYPFVAPGSSVSAQALQLCEDFYQVFRQEVKKLDYIEEIHCSMGLVLGQVQGLYTQHPPIQYDLEGHALVLATRYEAARKLVTQSIYKDSASFLTIQETVYFSLPPAQQARFTPVSLSPEQAKKLEDPEASALYVLNLRTSVFKTTEKKIA